MAYHPLSILSPSCALWRGEERGVPPGEDLRPEARVVIAESTGNQILGKGPETRDWDNPFPVDRQTDVCKNITFRRTTYGGGNDYSMNLKSDRAQ